MEEKNPPADLTGTQFLGLNGRPAANESQRGHNGKPAATNVARPVPPPPPPKKK